MSTIQRVSNVPPWQEIAANGYGPDLLPILPPFAIMAGTSRVKPNSLGKVPGILTHAGTACFGLRDWTGLQATPADWERWAAMRFDNEPFNIGLQTRGKIVFDLDVE